MTRGIFEPGTLFVLHGVAYRVLNQPEPGLVLVSNLQTNRVHSLLTGDLWKSWADGDVQFSLSGEKLDKEGIFLLDAAISDDPPPEGESSPPAQREQALLSASQMRWDLPLTRPNQRVELQFATLELLIVDDHHDLPLGQPTLAAIRDGYSGYPLGITISFDPPSDLVAMECMYFAFSKKDRLGQRLTSKNVYLAYGLPEVLVVDPTIGESSTLQEACSQLGIELQALPPSGPWLAEALGQWLEAQNQDLIRVVPRASIPLTERGGRAKPSTFPCMTLDRFWEALHCWIIDGYTQEVQHGVGGGLDGKGIPARLWLQALESNFVPHLPLKSADFLTLLPRTTVRQIDRYGILLEGLTYHSRALTLLRAALILSGRGVAVKVKYCSGDLSRIWVLDPLMQEYIEVETREKQYASGLVLQESRRRATRKGTFVEVEALLDDVILQASQTLPKRPSIISIRDRYTGFVFGFSLTWPDGETLAPPPTREDNV
jgi:hypothetical protein